MKKLTKSRFYVGALVLTVSALVPMVAIAAPTAPATRADVSSLATAESNVVKVLHSYKPTASWKTRYKAALAKQTADVTKLNKALGKQPTPAKATTTTTSATTTTTTTTVSVSIVTGTPAQFDIEAVTAPARPGPGTLTVTVLDSTTGQTLGTWTAGSYSSLLTGPPDLWLDWDDIGATGSPTDTLVLDGAYSGPSWTGPASITVPHADLLNADIGVVAAFAGQPGYAPSKSTLAVL